MNVKTIFLLLATAVAVPAHAETWKLVTDSDTGHRLVVDIDTIEIERYADEPKAKYRVFGLMQYLAANQDNRPFVAVIDAEDCLSRGAGRLIIINGDGSEKSYFWDLQGLKMYDAQAQYLCGWLTKATEIKKAAREKRTM